MRHADQLPVSEHGTRTLAAIVEHRVDAERLEIIVQALGRWMPAGILLILAVVVLHEQGTAHPGRIVALGIASAVTVAVHLLFRRRALLSIAAGTACYVALINLL